MKYKIMQAPRARDIGSHANRYNTETPVQAYVCHIAHARSQQLSQRLAQARISQTIHDKAILFHKDQVIQHNCDLLNVLCLFCGSRNVAAERHSDGKFTSCWRKEKIKLRKPLDANGDELHCPSYRELL